MPFGIMNGLGPRNNLLRGVTIPEGGGANLEGKHVLDKPNTPMNCELDWSMQRRAHDRQTLDCKRWTSLLSAAKGVGLHTAGEV